VDDDAKFASVAERTLRRQGRSVDFRNLGFSGGTAADYVRLGPSIVERYRPAAMVIQLTAQDFGPESFDNSRPNYFVRAPDGKISLQHRQTPAARPSFAARLKHASALVNYLHVRLLTILEYRATGDANTARASAGVDATAATVPAQLQLLKQAYGEVPVILLLLPWTPKIERGALLMSDASHDGLIRTIRDTIGDWPHWTLVDPSSEFAGLAPGALPRGFSDSVPGRGHLNREGHRAAGDALASAVAALLR
jgi:lysophospholipase L1-like esterase